jgi:SAM-dependent methyltransferase
MSVLRRQVLSYGADKVAATAFSDLWPMMGEVARGPSPSRHSPHALVDWLMSTEKHQTVIRYLYERLIKLQHWIMNYPEKKPTLPEGLTPEAVVWAYRLFLDREPENQEVVDYKLKNFTNIHELRREFMHSYEFKKNNPIFHSPALSGDEPPMLIEDSCSDVDLQTLFSHIQDAWQYLGETEPHWSVWTSDEFHQSDIHTMKNVFYDSGRKNVINFFRALERNGIDYTSFKLCLDYGCGLGRVTYWLSKKFEKVFGYDISQSHLLIAKNYLAQEGANNINLFHIKRVNDLTNLPKVDCIYSVVTLQHNPPPIINLIIREFIKSLNSGGIAFFQVPTYRLGYDFSISKYLNDELPRREIEMHILPQRIIFEGVRREGGKIIELLEDYNTIQMHMYVSNMFLVQKG